MLDAHTREPITVITQRCLSVLRFCRWSKMVRHQKSALFCSEIRMERSHSIFCTNHHKIDIITTVLLYYCSLVGLNTSIQEKTVEFRAVLNAPNFASKFPNIPARRCFSKLVPKIWKLLGPQKFGAVSFRVLEPFPNLCSTGTQGRHKGVVRRATSPTQ